MNDEQNQLDTHATVFSNGLTHPSGVFDDFILGYPNFSKLRLRRRLHLGYPNFSKYAVNFPFGGGADPDPDVVSTKNHAYRRTSASMAACAASASSVMSSTSPTRWPKSVLSRATVKVFPGWL